MMVWKQTKRADKAAAKIADRHYSRQTVGSDQFTPPGRVLVLVTHGYDALWATNWPYPQYVNRIYPDAWVNTIFRNESDALSSELIIEAIAATRWYFGDPPSDGMITLIDTKKVKPIKRRGVNHWGYTYEKAGFKHIDFTKGGLMIFQLKQCDMPQPERSLNSQMKLFSMM